MKRLMMVWVVCLMACSDPPSGSPGEDTRGADTTETDTAVSEDSTTGEDANGSDTSVSSGDATDTGGDTGPALVGGCATETPENCTYEPEATYTQIEEDPLELQYVDAAGVTRQVRIQVRRPDGDPGPLPIVVWSHGGASGRANPSTVATSWGEVYTRAGYVFVAVAHLGRDEAQRQPLCGYLGYDTAGCATFKYLSWDRPHDIRRVLDWLDEQAAGDLAGRIDTSKILYAGHSAGAGSSMMVAGATRDFAGTQLGLSDPRPIAFMGCSPQGPGDDGFIEASYATLERPFLVLTGAGDDTTGNVAENRSLAHDLMAPGDKYQGWIAEETARHTTFNFETATCEREGGSPDRCAEYLTWLSSAALAFADGHLREDPEAQAYLESANLSVLSADVVEWSLR